MIAPTEFKAVAAQTRTKASSNQFGFSSTHHAGRRSPRFGQSHRSRHLQRLWVQCWHSCHESTNGWDFLLANSSGLRKCFLKIKKIMTIAAASGMKRVAFVVIALMAMALPSVLGAAPRGWKGGAHITFYGSPNGGGTQAGACGYQNTYKLGYGSMTAALSSPMFNDGAACGACYQIRCAPVRLTRVARNWCWSMSRTISVTATNLCPPGSRGGWCDLPRHHFDLPMPAFLTLARREGGVAPVYYRKVRCAKRGGIRFTMGGNPWFLMVLIHNVGGVGDVRFVRIKGEYTGWYSMYRNWGAVWTVRTKPSGALTFAVTTSDGRTVVSRNAVGSGWRFGQTWEAGSNFRY